MPSPDVAAYLGLTLIETDAQALVTEALARAGVVFPDWEPREGNTEVVLLEEHAAMLEELVFAVNRLPDGMTEVLLRLFGATRDPGSPPSLTAEFTLTDTLGHTIPAGTVVRLDLPDPVDFTTLEDLVIAPGVDSGVVEAAAGVVTLLANGKPTGTVLQLLDAIPYVETVTVSGASIGGGTLAEDGAAFLARAMPKLARLNSTLVLAADFEDYAAETAAVHRVKCLDQYTSAGAGEPGDDNGFITVAVAALGGGDVAAAVKVDLAARLQARSHAGLIVTVVDADLQTVDVSIEVLKRRGVLDDGAIATAVEDALRTYLHPDTWEWDGTVRVNELIAIADRVAGVDTVLDVTLPAADLDLTGHAPLAQAGTINVTVTAAP